MAKPGKFSIYDFEKKGVVSIWLATVPLSRIPNAYLQEHYGDDDEPFNQFAEDFGFGFYDHDSVDTNASQGRAKPVEDLVGQCSFSSSYLEQAVAEAKKRGLDKTQFVFLMYDIEYAPKARRCQRAPTWSSSVAFAMTARRQVRFRIRLSNGRRTVSWPLKLKLRSFHGDVCIAFFTVVIVASRDWKCLYGSYRNRSLALINFVVNCIAVKGLRQCMQKCLRARCV